MKKIICSLLIVILLVFGLLSIRTKYVFVAAVDDIGEPYATVLKLPRRSIFLKTTLEFWIGEYVTEDDYADHARLYNGFLGKDYERDENETNGIPYCRVRYDVEPYPHTNSKKQAICEIEITDPEVLVFGISTNDSIEYFKQVFEFLGADVWTRDGYAHAKLGDATFIMVKESGKSPSSISIYTHPTGKIYI